MTNPTEPKKIGTVDGTDLYEESAAEVDAMLVLRRDRQLGWVIDEMADGDGPPMRRAERRPTRGRFGDLPESGHVS